MDFIYNNNFTITKNDITKKFQRDLRNSINECQQIIHKDDRWRYINLNPTVPKIRGLVKIHKDDPPIRPIVNWKNAQARKLAKMLYKKARIIYPPPIHF
jgi:hypothetical protein